MIEQKLNMQQITIYPIERASRFYGKLLTWIRKHSDAKSDTQERPKYKKLQESHSLSQLKISYLSDCVRYIQ